MTLQPPTPMEASRGGTLRFAVGESNGIRSSTWIVIGGSSGRDVYLGARGYLGVAKLSLHESGDWRVAYTSQFAASQQIKGDRVLQYLQPPAPMAHGWRRAATIVVPTSSLRSPFPESVRPSSPISWWPAPKPDWTINFEVMVSDPQPNFDPGATFDGIGVVGRIPLLGGGGVMVVADEKRFQPWESSLEGLRQKVRAEVDDHPASLSHPASLAWGTADDDGHAVFFDLGDPSNVADNVQTGDRSQS